MLYEVITVRQVCDSRILNLKAIKAINPSIETVFIKPPAKRTIPNVVRFADISLNTQVSTVRLLSGESLAQGKAHKIILMVELGERREGIHLEELRDVYRAVRELPVITSYSIHYTKLYDSVRNDQEVLSRASL